MTTSAPVRFLHAADLHLGKVFSGLSALDRSGDLADAVNDTLDALIALALDEEVDFVILAGDTFDTLDVSYAVQRSFVRAMERLEAAGIAVYLVTGNHDPLVSWQGRLDSLPANVHVFPHETVGRIEHVREGAVVAALYGRSYYHARESENFACGYQRVPSDEFAIGVLHTSVADTDAYAPCTPADLRAAAMDYWALGHIHRQSEVLDAPLAIQPGSPQGLNVNERSVHGVRLVERSSAGVLDARFVPLARVTWARLEVDVTGLDSVQQVGRSIAEAARAAIAEARTSVGARVVLTGRSDVHALLTPTTLGHLADELNDELDDPGAWAFIDAIVDRSELPIDLAAFTTDGLFGAVVREELDLLAQRGVLPEELASGLATLTGRTDLVSADELPGLIDRAWTLVTDSLMGEGGR